MIFSVITITYNAEKTLESTIQSVVNQTYPHVEYIIIDGSSSDGTKKIIDSYSNKTAYSISEPDAGLYDAMNKGLAKATGDYVWFINSGDKIHDPDTIEKIIAEINGNTPPDIIYGETAIIDPFGNFKYMRRLKAPEKLFWKSFKKGMVVSHQAFIVKRDIAPEFDLKYRFSSDFDWCIRCMKKASTIFNSRLILADYLEEGTTTGNLGSSLKERYEIMAGYYGKTGTFFFHLWFAVRFAFARLFKRQR